MRNLRGPLGIFLHRSFVAVLGMVLLNGSTLFAGGDPDVTPPAVLSCGPFNPAGPWSNGATTLVYRVTFDEPVTGVDAGDFALTMTGTASGVISGVLGQRDTYYVTVGTVTGRGTLRLDLRAAGSAIADLAANPLAEDYASGRAYVLVPGAAVYGSGYNHVGELGTNTIENSSVMVAAVADGALSGEAIVAVSAGHYHTLALSSSGRVFGWGYNLNGQLGDGSTTNRHVPVAVDTSGVLAGKSVAAISAGNYHGLALTDDHLLFAWGSNTYGQLGTGGGSSSVPVAVDVTGALSGKTVVAVAGGRNHSLALTADGRVFSWGWNSKGQLGDGSTTNRSTPVAVDVAGVLADKTVVAIAAGFEHSLALTSDGRVVAWGSNSIGQLGDGSTTESHVPVLVSNTVALDGKKVAGIAAGQDYSLAVTADGLVFAWGSDGTYQLGNGASGSSIVPVAVTASGALLGKTIVAVAAGSLGGHSVALGSDGQVFTWGSNSFGQLGDGSTISRNDPVAVPRLSGAPFTGIASGSSHTVVLASPVPIVESVAAANGAYRSGQHLDVTVTLGRAATVDTSGGTPRLVLDVGGATRYAQYLSGSTTNQLVFRYTVQPGDTDADGVTFASSLDLAGGSIVATSGGEPLLLELHNIAPTTGVTVVTAPPTLTAPAISNLGANQVTLRLTSDVSGTGYFTLITGAEAAGTGAQTRLGQNAAGLLANRHGSRPLTAGVTGEYTVRNLAAGMTYTVVFTADDGSTLQATPATASFTTAVAPDLSVMNWRAAGGVGVSPTAVSRQVIAMAPDGTPHVAYLNASRITVLKYDGSSWTSLGSPAFSNDASYFLGLAFAPDGTPHVVYRDLSNASRATVMKYTGAAPTGWAFVGSAGFTSVQADYPVLDFAPDGTPYVAFQDYVTKRAAVMKYVGGAAPGWESVAGAVSVGTATYLSLAFNRDGSPWIAYRDTSSSDKVTVMKSTGGGGAGWETVGSAGFTPGYSFELGLAFTPDGTPYVGYRDGRNSPNWLGFLLRYTGVVDAEWEIASGQAFSPAGIANLSLATGPDGAVFVAFRDPSTVSVGATVMRLQGNAWDVVGNRGFSSGTAQNPSVAIAPDGRPWVAYQDGAAGNRLTVMMLAQAITSVEAPSTGSYGVARYLDFVLNFGTAVTVNTAGGTPRLKLTIGATTRYASYVSGSGTTALLFRYAVQAADADSDGLAVAPAIELNGGTLRDGSNEDVSLLFSVDTAGVLVDTVAPVISSVAVPAAGTYGEGQTLDFALQFSKAVTVDTTLGRPRIALTIGATTRYATYVSGSGTAALLFSYALQASDADGDGIALGALALDGGTIKDAAGNNATLTLNGVGSTAGVLVAATPVAVSSIARHSPGPLVDGVSVAYRVTFNQDVTGVSADDFVLTTTGTAAGTIASVATASGAVYDVTVNALAGVGSLRLDLDSGTDISGSPAGFTSGQTYWRASGAVPVGWGSNASYQLNDGTATHRPSPVVVRMAGTALAGKTIAAVANGAEHTLVLTSDGEVYAWGANARGQLGNGVAGGSSSVPVAVDVSGGSALAGKTVIAIAAGQYHNLALASDGTVVAWGENGSGQLGDGSTTDRSSPVSVSPAPPGCIAIAAGGNHSLALTTGGRVWGWGNNAQSALGDTTTVSRSTAAPVSIAAGTSALAGKTVVAIAAGDNHGVALTADGRLCTWGYNVFGQLGDGSSVRRSSPVAITTGALAGKTVSAFAIGAYHGIALATDGTLATWGYNVSGQLGDGSNVNRSAPVLVDTAAGASALAGQTVVDVAAGHSTSYAVTANGTVTSWGDNYSGQLGDGTIGADHHQSVPVALDATPATSAMAAGTTHLLSGGCEAVHAVALATVVPSTVSVAVPAAAAYPADQTLEFTVSFDARVAVTGTPRLTLTVGATARQATYVSGTDTTALLFRYTTQAGDNDADGIALGAAIDLDGGTITAVVGGAAANTTLNGVGATAGILVDTLAPAAPPAPTTVANPTTNRRPAITGTAEAASTVKLYDGVTLIGTTTAAGAGNWSFTPSSDLGLGAHTLTVTATDAAGNVSGASPALVLTIENPPAPPPSKDDQTISFASLADAVVGQTVTLSANATSGLPVSFSVVSGPATLSGNTLTLTGIGAVTVRASQSGNVSYEAAPHVDRSFAVTIGGAPSVITPTHVPAPPSGGTATIEVPESSPLVNYQWQRNGADLAGATGPSLALESVQPANAGLYSYSVSTDQGTVGTSEPVIVGVSTEDKVTGTGDVVDTDVHHPNGNTYDQLILQGEGATLTADPDKVTRMSFNDLSEDIVQVEFSGAGSLSLVMDDASTPAPPVNYNQPDVHYVRGHVGIVITGANETTNLTVISVGRVTAFDPTGAYDLTKPISETNDPALNGNPIFDGHPASDYDGVANVAFVAIQSANGNFGGIRTGNVEYFAASGFTSVYAPGVQFTGPINIGDIQAHDNAQPVLIVGSASEVRITGGSLFQPNGRAVKVKGLTQLRFTEGRTSQNAIVPAQSNRAVLEQDGVDVTDLIVVGP